MKRWEILCHASDTQNRAGVVILMSNKTLTFGITGLQVTWLD